MIIKKLAVAVALAGAIAVPVKADMLGLYIGAQGWQNEVTGAFSQDSSSLVDFNFDDKVQTNLYVKFEHPVPLIPNARVRLGTLEGLGNAELSESFTFDNYNYDLATTLDSAIELTNNDATLYWELLDNDIIAFDFGLTAKHLDGDIAVTGTANGSSATSTENISIWLPMGYAAVKVRVPFAGVYVYGDANYVSYDGSNVHDYEVGIGYDIMDNLAVDVALTAGYRELAIELDDVDDLSANVKFSGFFAGLEVHF